ncbi:MAG: hypothetical protein E6I52_22840 [Chloroflexi bacterium]|nr:MAG: hypothetical protein E6I52_22840 [Chloroflexota bacterium]
MARSSARKRTVPRDRTLPAAPNRARRRTDHLQRAGSPFPPVVPGPEAARAHQATAPPAEVRHVIRGTTLLTNAIIERKGARTARGWRSLMSSQGRQVAPYWPDSHVDCDIGSLQALSGDAFPNLAVLVPQALAPVGPAGGAQAARASDLRMPPR